MASNLPNKCGYVRCRRAVRFIFKNELREIRACSLPEHRIEVFSNITQQERGALYETKKIRNRGEVRTLLSPSISKDGILASNFDGTNNSVLSYEEARIMREQLDILSTELMSMTDTLANRVLSENDLLHSILAMRKMLSIIRRENRDYQRNIDMMRLQETHINDMLHKRAIYLQSTRKLCLHSLSNNDGCECSICMDAITSENGGLLACKHSFHTDCISMWVNQDSSQCPICRANIDDSMFVKINGMDKTNILT